MAENSLRDFFDDLETRTFLDDAFNPDPEVGGDGWSELNISQLTYPTWTQTTVARPITAPAPSLAQSLHESQTSLIDFDGNAVPSQTTGMSQQVGEWTSAAPYYLAPPTSSSAANGYGSLPNGQSAHAVTSVVKSAPMMPHSFTHQPLQPGLTFPTFAAPNQTERGFHHTSDNDGLGTFNESSDIMTSFDINQETLAVIDGWSGHASIYGGTPDFFDIPGVDAATPPLLMGTPEAVGQEETVQVLSGSSILEQPNSVSSTTEEAVQTEPSVKSKAKLGITGETEPEAGEELKRPKIYTAKMHHNAPLKDEHENLSIDEILDGRIGSDDISGALILKVAKGLSNLGIFLAINQLRTKENRPPLKCDKTIVKRITAALVEADAKTDLETARRNLNADRKDNHVKTFGGDKGYSTTDMAKTSAKRIATMLKRGTMNKAQAQQRDADDEATSDAEEKEKAPITSLAAAASVMKKMKRTAEDAGLSGDIQVSARQTRGRGKKQLEGRGERPSKFPKTAMHEESARILL